MHSLKMKCLFAAGQPLFNNTALNVGTNWQDSIFGNAPIESFNMSVTGGTKNSSHSIGGNYFTKMVL